MTSSTESVLEDLKTKYSHQPTFLQAVDEVVGSLGSLLDDSENLKVFKVLIEPERTIQFRVVWHDRNGDTIVNRGWRIQFNSALGPYKGGLRFHPTVDEGVLKFLGFEQTFKNALTGLPMGGGKGGSDFDPKGKTDAEVRDFCVAFMTELSRHIGENTDVPAGDINVGAREIGFLYGVYKRIKNETVGVLTGKGLTWGGSEIRPEATGYGVVYLAREALRHKLDTSLKGKRCVVSGCGNVAQHTMEKLLHLDAVVLGCSDSKGCILKPSGLTVGDLEMIKHNHNVDRKRLQDLDLEDAKYFAGESIWNTKELSKFDFAFPCATQNELQKSDAEHLITRDISAVFEGANMPCTRDAVGVFHRNKILYVPGKASNAGGVAVSGLEMAQNSQREHWTRETTDEYLQKIMRNIYAQISDDAYDSLEQGANRAGFKRISQAMRELGWT